MVPALDYDGDGQREFAVFSDETVAAYRIVETPETWANANRQLVLRAPNKIVALRFRPQ